MHTQNFFSNMLSLKLEYFQIFLYRTLFFKEINVVLELPFNPLNCLVFLANVNFSCLDLQCKKQDTVYIVHVYTEHRHHLTSHPLTHIPLHW